jgi:hypothetical protein
MSTAEGVELGTRWQSRGCPHPLGRVNQRANDLEVARRMFVMNRASEALRQLKKSAAPAGVGLRADDAFIPPSTYPSE